MGPKRSAESDGETSTKRQRSSTSFKPGKSSASGIDQTYGQRGAFGSLENTTTAPDGDSDLDCEDDTDALAYLISVRVQAAGIPHILIAERAGPQLPPQLSETLANREDQIEHEDGVEEPADRSIYKDGTGDFRGFYQDGAYIARPADSHDEHEDDEEYDEYGEEDQEEYGEDAPQEYDEEDTWESSEDGPHNSSSDEIRDAYFTSLANQYLSLRKVLQTDPPESALAALPRSNPVEVGHFGRDSKSFSQWSGRLRGTDPLPAQVAGMHKDSVIRLLRIILGGKFLRKGHELRERTSRWIWSLLARLPEKGELDYQEIGWIRELGKRAVLFMVSLAELQVLQQEYDVGASGDSEDGADVDVDEGVEEELSPDTSRGQDNSTDGEPNEPKPNDHVQAQSSNTTKVSASSGQAKDDAKSNGSHIDANPNIPEEKEPSNLPAQQITEPASNGVKTAEESPSTALEMKSHVEPMDQKAEVSNEESDVEMQLDTDVEEGEVSDHPGVKAEQPADIEAAKARLLAQLESAEGGETAPSELAEAESPSQLTASEVAHAPILTAAEKKAERAKINVRATLNMILTVAGEFYGQRDLLEFRDPFGGLDDD